MLTDAVPSRVSDDWESAHGAFHRAVIAGCGNARLVEITDGLRDCAELYRRWSGPRDPERDVSGEHRRILDAALARDGDEAAAALRDHYTRTLAVLVGPREEGAHEGTTIEGVTREGRSSG